MDKYYYVVTKCYQNYHEHPYPQNFVTDKHPFIAVAELQKSGSDQTMVPAETYLMSWQEITKEEYDLYQEMKENETLYD